MRLVEGALARAQAEQATALVILLDTPGGLERSMRAICQRLLNAEIPVIVYVAPTGARAASAGVFITMAAHVAAMAPATNIGAAHPVAVGGGLDKESLRKIENDSAAFARTIAIERGRNAEWAEKAVRQSVSITEREAVKLKVVDLVADSVPDLLEKIDGRTVKTVRGPVTLATKGVQAKAIEIGFRDRFLNLITDPNVAYILMMLGMLGLFFELSNPGVILPGVIGGISLILAFFAFQSLPINWAGLLLIAFGIVLLIAEIKIVSHGVLAIGGIIAMALGSMMLFDAPEMDLRVAWSAIVPMVGATALLFMFVVATALRTLKSRVAIGTPALVGQTGVARGALSPQGQVMIHGELWQAVIRGAAVEEGRPRARRRRERLDAHRREDGGGRRDVIPMEWLFTLVVVVVALFFLGSFIRIVPEYERVIIFRLGRRTKAIFNPGGDGNGPGLVLLVPLIDKIRQRISLRTVATDVPPQDVITRDNVSIKVNAVHLLPRHQPRSGLPLGRGLHLRDLAAGPDDPAQRARPDGARRPAGRPRQGQPAAAADHRRAHRAVGREGLHGGGQADRPAPGHAARDVQAGRGRARAPRQGHQRRRRVPGRGQAVRGRRGADALPGRPAAALSADDAGDRLGAEHHHVLPAADGPDRAAARTGSGAEAPKP